MKNKKMRYKLEILIGTMMVEMVMMAAVEMKRVSRLLLNDI